MYANKRKSQRLDCVVPIEGKEDGAFGSSTTVDISKGGIGFVSPTKVPVNKEIVVELSFDPYKEPVLALGKVKWVRKAEDGNYRIGMFFKDVFHGSKSRLNRYFKSMV